MSGMHKCIVLTLKWLMSRWPQCNHNMGPSLFLFLASVFFPLSLSKNNEFHFTLYCLCLSYVLSAFLNICASWLSVLSCSKSSMPCKNFLFLQSTFRVLYLSLRIFMSVFCQAFIYDVIRRFGKRKPKTVHKHDKTRN